ncbi:EAL domain-containing protein [bacterium]|nr:EAL domain-containing protein [bacterium]MBU1433718.1 EAL domain-containing protein [bacterium]MBU1503793.1 EAL domain-containing protein [bacterium]
MIFRQYFQSIKTRLIVNVILIHAILMGLVVYDLHERESKFIEKQLSTKGYDLTSILASNASTPLLNNDLIALKELIRDMGTIKDFHMSFILDKEYRVRASSSKEYFNITLNDTASKKLFDKVNNTQEHSSQIIHDEFIDTISKIHVNERTIGYVRTLLSNNSLESELKVITTQGLVYILFAILAGALFTWLSIRKMTKSLNIVSDAARQIAMQNFDVSLPEPKENDEVSNVVKAFRVMQSSLNQYVIDIEKAKKRYETLFKNNKAVELIINPNTQEIVDFNQAALDFYGYSADEMKKLLISDINTLSVQEIQNELEDVKEHKRNYFVFQHRLADGSIKNVEVYSGPLELDGQPHIYSIVHDISKRISIEKEKNEIQERLNLALEGSSDGLWDWDLVTNEVYFSPRYKEMLGYRDDEFFNSFASFEEHLHPEDKEKTLNFVTSFLHSTDIYYEQKFRMRTNSGEYIPIMARAKKVLDLNEKAIRLTGTHVDMSEITKAQENLKFQAEHDALTALPNRLLFLDRLEQSIKHAKRHEEKVAVLFMDLDHFKEINDSLGHDAGDELLKKISLLVQNIIRMSDTMARIGGDEFTIMIERIENNDVIIEIVEKIMETLRSPQMLGEHTVYTSFSVGIAIYPDDGKNAQELLKNADAAMYKAKSKGRNRYEFYTEDMTIKAMQRVLLENSIREAIKNEEFEVYYQPQVDGRNDKIIGLEALIRWNHPQDGLVSPLHFIPLAEETGLIVHIDNWVMRTVMKQTYTWHQNDFYKDRVSINISVFLLNNSDFISFVKKSLQESQCNPEWLEFEITESHIILDVNKSIKILQELNSMGIKISIDDFGTGYSSLAYLKRLPIDKLKIDQSFVRDIMSDESDREIVRTIIAMAKNLHMNVIAEGVETKEQKEFLVQNGCHEIQGYFYYKPLPITEINIILKN